MRFEWDKIKAVENEHRHGISFAKAQHAFLDSDRVLAEDTAHSTAKEKRYYCFGKVDSGILTVRFTLRDNHIRIIGAGYWRKGKQIYETQNR
jgi:uncharacterized DUF497 family protein